MQGKNIQTLPKSFTVCDWIQRWKFKELIIHEAFWVTWFIYNNIQCVRLVRNRAKRTELCPFPIALCFVLGRNMSPILTFPRPDQPTHTQLMPIDSWRGASRLLVYCPLCSRLIQARWPILPSLSMDSRAMQPAASWLCILHCPWAERLALSAGKRSAVT